MARPRKAETNLAEWLGYAFVPAGALAEFGVQTTSPEIVKYSADGTQLERWPVEVVLANLAFFAANFWWLKNRDDKLARPTATMTEIEQWIALTRVMATTIPYGGTLSKDMLAIADRVDKLQNTPKRFSTAAPRSRTEELPYRFTLTLWAMNEIRKTARLSPIRFWQKRVSTLAAAALPQDHLNVFDDDAVEKRIKRFAKKLRPGSQPRLMAEVLLDATVHGPLLADGSSRNKTAPKPPAATQ